MSLKKSKLALAIAATAGLTFSSGAFATNGIMQVGNGMAAHGTGGAGLSNANEAMAGFDNPALIGQTGDSISMGFSVFMPDRQVDTTAAVGPFSTGTQVSDSKVFAIPQVAFTSKINNAMSWGIMVNALGGMNTDYRTGPMTAPPAANTNPQTVDLSGMIVAPTLSYAFGKNATVGASLLIGYTNFRVRNLFGSGLSDEGSTVGYGVKLGADFKLTDGISIGAILQPKVAMDEFEFFKSFLASPQFGFTGDAALTLPNIAGVGAKFAVGKMNIVTDLMYYQWTSVDVFEFFGWDDQFVIKAGLEFPATDKLTLRAGLNYGESPIQGGNRTGNGASDAAFSNYPFPAISEQHITVGLGYKMDKNMAINAYYLHSPEACQTATTVSSGPTPAGTEICMTQNAFGLGFNYAAK